MATFDDCKTISDFTDAENDLGMAKEEHLRRAGWTHTSDTPGHVWMWKRTVDGRDVLVDFATAWRIQCYAMLKPQVTADEVEAAIDMLANIGVEQRAMGLRWGLG